MPLTLTISLSIQGCSDGVTAREKPSQKLAAIKGGIAAAYPVATVLNERHAHAMNNAMHNKGLVLCCFDVPDSSGHLKLNSLPQIDA